MDPSCRPPLLPVVTEGWVVRRRRSTGPTLASWLALSGLPAGSQDRVPAVPPYVANDVRGAKAGDRQGLKAQERAGGHPAQGNA